MTETNKPQPEKSNAEFKLTPVRSPNFPVYKLESAIAKAKILYEAYKMHRVPVKAATEKMGFSTPSSSTTLQALAALKSYGFIDVQGKGDGRMVAVTEDAAKIIAKHPSAEALIKKAALAPKIHSEMYTKFFGPDGFAPDETMQHYLCFDRAGGKFNDQTVEPFLRQMKATFQFAKLSQHDRMSVDEPDYVEKELEIGDFVQWDSAGVAQFPEPLPITGFSPDHEFVFVDEKPCGMPIGEIRKADVPVERMKQVNQPAPPLQATNHTYSSSGNNVGGNSSASSSSATKNQIPPANPNYKLPGPSSGFRQAVLPSAGGDIVVRWPMAVSAKEYEIIDKWLEMLKGMIKTDVSNTPGKIEL